MADSIETGLNMGVSRKKNASIVQSLRDRMRLRRNDKEHDEWSPAGASFATVWSKVFDCARLAGL